MPIENRAGHLTHHTQSDGDGKPVLMLHCTMGNAGAWRGLIEHLGPDHRFTAFDMPGHGKSAPWHQKGDFHTITTEIAKTFLDQPMDLIGHSYGGTIAVRLALELPKMVRSLVLIEPVLMNLAFADNPELKALYAQDHQGFEEAWQRGDLETAAREFSRLWGDGRPWQDVPERAKQTMIDKIGMIKAGEHNVIGDRYGFSKPGRLAAVDVPVLLIEGAASHLSAGAVNTALQHRLPQAQRKVIEDAGHMVPITHAAKTAQAIDGFWQGIGTR